MTKIELEDFIQSYGETFTVTDLLDFFKIDDILSFDDDEIYASCIQYYANQLEPNKNYSFRDMCKVLELPVVFK